MITLGENTTATGVAQPSKDDARVRPSSIAIACVLCSGVEYASPHFARMLGQVKEHLPGSKFRCFSDISLQGVEVKIEL